MLLHGLADRIQREMIMLESPGKLDGLVDLALRVDSCLQQRDQHNPSPLRMSFPGCSTTDPGFAISHSPDNETMQVGRARLSWEERECRRRRGLCMYCGAVGHLLVKCPVKDQA